MEVAPYAVQLPGCWTQEDLHEVASLCGPWGCQARWPPEAVLLFLLNWAMDNRQHTFERYLPEAWPLLRALVQGWALPMAPVAVTPAALCQVRQRLGMRALQALHQKANAHASADLDMLTRRWGLRLWAVDGSWLNLPPEPVLAKQFGRPSGTENGRLPLPQALLVSLDLVNLGWIVDYRLEPCHYPELRAGIALAAGLGPGDLLLADRLFFDTPWMKELRDRCVELLWRVTAVRWKSFCDASRTNVRELRQRGGIVDCQVMLKVDTDHRGQPRGGLLPLRYLELPPCHSGQETMRLLTSLSAERLPAHEAADGYHQRWGVETDIRFYKGPDHLPVVLSRKPDTVQQEVLLRLLAHNWVRSVQAQACLLARAADSGSFPPSGDEFAARPDHRRFHPTRLAPLRYRRHSRRCWRSDSAASICPAPIHRHTATIASGPSLG